MDRWSRVVLPVISGILILSMILGVSFDDAFAKKEKITICHKPGTPAEKTKEVPESALAGHLGHGDFVGICAPPPIVPIEIGTLGGDLTFVTDINDVGQIVGFSETPSGERHAFFWDNGVMTDIHSIGDSSIARAINNAGQVVGEARLSSPSDTISFLWDPENGFVELDSLTGVSPKGTSAFDINESGQVVGIATNLANMRTIVLWDSNTGIQDLGTLGGTSTNTRATGINNAGQVTGFSATAAGGPFQEHAFFWENGVMTDLGPARSAPDPKINEVGQIIFNSPSGGFPQTIIWDSVNGLVNTGLSGLDFNDLGQVVGSVGGPCPSFGSGVGCAAIWDSVNGIQIIGTISGASLESSRANSINNAGQVVGFNKFGFAEPTTERAFLWDSVNGIQGMPLNPGEGNTAQFINEVGQFVGFNDEPIPARDILLWGPINPNSISLDSDGDGIVDVIDNCPTISNSDQSDTNNNGLGDVCDVVNTSGTVISIDISGTFGVIQQSGGALFNYQIPDDLLDSNFPSLVPEVGDTVAFDIDLQDNTHAVQVYKSVGCPPNCGGGGGL